MACSTASTLVGVFAMTSLLLAKPGEAGDALPSLLERTTPGIVETTLFNIQPWTMIGQYFINITVGTPPQPITVNLDSGSSDLWFATSTAHGCAECRGGFYNPSNSSTYKLISSDSFDEGYSGKGYASGDYATDVIGIGDIQIPNVQFGVANNVSSGLGLPFAVMGTGSAAVENSAQGPKYPNVLASLHQSGAINSELYSIWMNQPGTATGKAIFGGIDTSLYTGKLHVVDMVPVPYPDATEEQNAQVWRPVVEVTALSFKVSGNVTTVFDVAQGGTAMPVNLDTGNNVWIVPQSIYNTMAPLWGGDVDELYTFPCDRPNKDATVQVQFGDLTVEVPMSSLSIPAYNSTSQTPILKDGQPVCEAGLNPDTNGDIARQGYSYMGDTFLRSLYMVYDQSNGQMGLAQANTNPGISNMVAVPAGPGGLAAAAAKGSGGVESAPPQTNSVDPEIMLSTSVSFSAAATPIGTVTGLAAIPLNGQMFSVGATPITTSGNPPASSGPSNTDSASSAASSTGAASVLRVTSVGYMPTIMACLSSIILGVVVGLA